jgi:hypothetical protein
MSRSHVSKRERVLLTRGDLLQFAEQITRHRHGQGTVLKLIAYDAKR